MAGDVRDQGRVRGRKMEQDIEEGDENRRIG